jgi:hypothetical protein
MSDRNLLTIKSNAQQDLAIGIALAAVGIILMILSRSQAGVSESGLAAFWLGALLTSGSVGLIIWTEDVAVTVDTVQKRLLISRKSRFGKNKSAFRFAEIDHVGVSTVGKAGRLQTYHLLIYLKGGKTVRTGRWSCDQSEIDSLSDEMAEAIGCCCRKGLRIRPAGGGEIIVAAVGAVVVYAVWFRIQVGAWCPAMWFGTAPPVIMLLAFSVLLTILKRLPRRD